MLLLLSLCVLGNLFINEFNVCLFFVLHVLHREYTVLIILSSCIYFSLLFFNMLLWICIFFLFACNLYVLIFLSKHLHVYNSDKLSTRLERDSFINLILSINFKLWVTHLSSFFIFLVVLKKTYTYLYLMVCISSEI